MYNTFYVVCHSDIGICMHACMHPHTHTNTHTRTHARVHTHTHIHTYNLHKWKQAVAGMLFSYPLVVLSSRFCSEEVAKSLNLSKTQCCLVLLSLFPGH